MTRPCAVPIPVNGPFVSVIVPVLNDAEALRGLLADLPPSAAVQVVVVLGAPPDDRIRGLQASRRDVRWVESPAGRAVQMNRGAALATGRWLLFLHADVRLPDDWVGHIRRLEPTTDIVGGSFRFTLASSHPMARVIEAGVALRVRWLGLPYGDQALFVRRDVFDAVGGYRDLALMEDVDLVRRVGRRGRLAHQNAPVRVSARRWETDGWVRRTAGNLGIWLLFSMGVGTERLASWYYPARAAGGESTPERRRRPTPQAPVRVAVVIPALNEVDAIGSVLRAIPAGAHRVVVADNGSTDGTPERARAEGAVVVSEPRRGYGRACQAGLRAVTDADVIVFLDADFSDYPEDMTRLVDPILEGRADFVMGMRHGVGRPAHARLGTTACVTAINRLWGVRYQDLGPFRAIRRTALDRLDMRDETWGWTIEMQIKAAEVGLAVLEVPVRQRDRIGQSKISGTVRGTVRAASRMLATIVALRLSRRRRLRARHAREDECVGPGRGRE